MNQKCSNAALQQEDTSASVDVYNTLFDNDIHDLP